MVIANNYFFFRLAKTIKQEVGDVDILVNNAGVLFAADFESLPEELIRKTYDVNVMAHFWVSTNKCVTILILHA